MPSKRDTLQKIYYDPTHPAGFGSLQDLTAASGLPRKFVREWLSGQNTYTLHRPSRIKFPRRRTIVSGIEDTFQADLVSVQNIARYNKGINFLLVVLNAFSRFAYVFPLKNKEGRTVANALEQLFREGHRPRKLHTDLGTEFYNIHVRKVLKKFDISLYSVHSNTKASLVERFNRTIKGRLYRYFHKQNTFHYLDVLQKLVHSYNSRKHRTLGMAPAEVNKDNQKTLWFKLYGDQFPERSDKFKYKVGDFVRISKITNTFEKKYVPIWTSEYFQISHRLATRPVTYKLKDSRGKTISGSFYEPQMQKIKAPDADTEYPIRILRKKKRNNQTFYLVDYIGWPKEYQEWMSENQLSNL